MSLTAIPLLERAAFALWRDESIRAATRERTYEQWLDESDQTRDRWRRAAGAVFKVLEQPTVDLEESFRRRDPRPLIQELCQVLEIYQHHDDEAHLFLAGFSVTRDMVDSDSPARGAITKAGEWLKGEK